MKLIRLLATTIAFIFCLTGLAHADPITGAIAVISGILKAGGIAAALLQTAFSVALSLGVGLLEKARARNRKVENRGIQFEIQMGDDQPLHFPIGFYAVAGLRKYAGVWGSGNTYFVDVIELSSLPISGLAGLWVGDQKCTIDYARPDPSGYGFPVTEFMEGGNDYLWIKFYDGTQTTADPYLLEKFGSDPDRPYKDTMIGRGVAYAVITSRFNTTLFSSAPVCLFEVQGIPVYDLRKDSTAGGSGSHRWADQSTWEASDNPIINAYNVIRGIYYGDDEWVYGGQDLAAFQLPASNIMAAANECDVAMTRADSSIEKQFRCGYEVRGNIEPLAVVEDLMQSCNGRVAEVGGKFKFLVGSPGAAVYSFTDDQVIITEGQSFAPFPALTDTFNGIEATYPEPKEKWATKDAPARYSGVLEAEDGDRRLASGVSFAAVPYALQVQQLMKAMIEEQRRFRAHNFHLPPDAWALEPNDVVAWTSARNGYTNKKFLVTAIEGERNFNQPVVLKEIDPTDYGWASSEELPTDFGWLGPVIPTPSILTGWTATPAIIKDTAGNNRRPTIKVGCAGGLDDVKNVHIQVRLKSSGEVEFDSAAAPYASPFAWVLNGTFVPNTLYQARGREVPFSNRKTEFSGWIDVTTPNVLITGTDILDGAIVSSKIFDAAITAAKIANEAVTSLKLADAAVTEAKIAVDAVTRNVIKNGEVITSKIADGAMTLLKFASGLKPVEGPFTTAPTTGNVEGRVAIIGASPNGKLMRYTGGAWTAAVDAVDLVGTIDTAQIAAGAITTAKIADLAIVAAKIGTGEISATKIADGAIINSKLGPLAVDAAKIATNAITNTKIADDAISTPKLQANAVVADKIAANSIGARQLIIADLSNLIPDSELMNIANWAVGGGGTQVFVSSQPGTYDGPVLRFTGDATADTGTTYIAGAVSKDFPVNEGQEYAYGGALDYTTGATGGITITIRWYDVSGTWFATAPELGFTEYPDAARHLFSGIATAPATAVMGRFYVRRRSTSAAGSVTGSVYAYMLYVRRAAAGELIVDGAITAGKIQANSITGDKIVANTIGARQLIIADLSNMVPDSALSDISGWTGTGSGEWSFSNTGLLMAAGRKASATGTWTTSSSDYAGALWSDYVPCEPGKDYAAGFVIDPEGGATGTLLGTLDFYDRDKVSLGFSNINSVAYDVSSSTALVSFSKIITSPADAAFVRFRVRRGALTSGGTAVGNVHFGSLYIRRAAAGELIVDGAISADKITANAITSSKIAADAVTAGKIAANAVTSDTITANAITSTKIAANSIAASHVQANVIGAKQLIVADFSNLVLDSSLADVANWSITAGVFSFVSSTGFGSAGGKAIRSNFSGVSAGAGTTYVGTCTTADRVPVESNKEYTVGGYINPSAGATGTVRISIYFYDKDNVAVGDDYVSLDVSSTTAEVPISKIVVAPTTAAYCAVAVRRYSATNGGGVGTGYVYAYNVFLRRASNGELIVDGAIIADKISSNAITTSKIAAGAVTATAIATGAITAVKIAAATITGDKIAANTLYADLLVADSITSRELILTDYSNLVVNGSFDTGDEKGYTTFPSGWDVIPNTNSGSSAYTNCVVPFMARIAPSAAAGGVYFNAGKAIDCKAGDQFSISARAAISSGGAAYTAECLRIIYYWKQADGSYTAGGSIYWPVGVSTSWTNSAGLLLHSVTAPSGAVGLRVRLYYNGTGTGATGNMVVSQCYVRRKANAELIIDGAIISDKIATNAITADKINVTSLSAISANLGSVNIEDAIIGTLTVGTSNIEANAVTATASMSGNSAGTPEDTVSLTGLMNNSPALISITGSYSISAGSGASGSFTMSVVNTTTGSTAWSFFVSYGSGNTSGGIDAFRIHSNTDPGTNNYELNISGAPGLSVDIDVKFLYWRR